MSPPVSRGFSGRRLAADPTRVPPGQYVTNDFPVLSAGPTPHRPSIAGTSRSSARSTSRAAFRTLPSEEIARVGKAPQLTDLRFRVVK